MTDTNNIAAKKYLFSTRNLIPFFIKKYDLVTASKESGIDGNAISEKIAEMAMFPYITENGIRHGKLKESGINWYYCDDASGNNLNSTDSYRILKTSEFEDGTVVKLKQIFGSDGKGYLKKFSSSVVINDLVANMEKEKSYSAKWWEYATDAFAKWDPKDDPGSNFETATKGIQDSYFLFDDQYCLPEFQQLFDRFQICKDIRDTNGYKEYIQKNPEKKTKDKNRFLQYLGIPSSFIVAKKYEKGQLSPIIHVLLQKIKFLGFPVRQDRERDYNLCRLAEYVFFHVIFKEDKNFLLDLWKDKDTVRSIPILSSKGFYLRASHSMFYLKNSVQIEIPGNQLNYLFISKNYSQDQKELIAYDIAEVEKYSKYSFMNVSEYLFYKWVWQFTRNEHLVDNLLTLFTKQSRIGIKDSEFPLDVLRAACHEKNGDYGENRLIATSRKDTVSNIRFTLDVTIESLINYRNVLNAVYDASDYNISIHMPGSDPVKEPWIANVKKQILDAAYRTDPSCYSMIDNNALWKHVYIIDSKNSTVDSYGQYVNVSYIDSRNMFVDNMILLVKDRNPNSYAIAIANYIYDYLGIKLENVTVNWKEEYTNLADQVRRFISRKERLIPDGELLFKESDMADVRTLDVELDKWKLLETKRKKILNNRIIESDYDYWNEFLNSKYHGRCQLCGNRTVSGKDTAHTWTYRIVKKKDNRLANIEANLFCLCPSCHGELSFGFKGKDLTSILNAAKEYYEQIQECLEEKPDDADTSDSIVSEFADYKETYEGFHSPIVCDVIVNGCEHKMKFSWEHFMNLAFLLESNANNDV